jgi:hypothetical protein
LDVWKSALTLFEAGILLVDDKKHTFAAYNLAINTSFLDRGFYLHG